MSDFQQNPGTGAIFKNEKSSDKHPDYKGTITTPNGEKLDIALWLKTAATSGKTYFSVSVSEPYKKSDTTGLDNAHPYPAMPKKEQPAPINDLPF